MPINVCDHFYRSFAQQVVPKAAERGIGVLGMKSLGGGSGQKGRLVVEKVCTAEEARRYALSQHVTSLVCGIDSMAILNQDLKIARNFKPMSAEEQRELLTKVKGVATDGRHERFKSTQLFDSDYHRQQHGLTEKEVRGQE
jgi:predicted aldo/keto reductase-like oxidoreductase